MPLVVPYTFVFHVATVQYISKEIFTNVPELAWTHTETWSTLVYVSHAFFNRNVWEVEGTFRYASVTKPLHAVLHLPHPFSRLFTLSFMLIAAYGVR